MTTLPLFPELEEMAPRITWRRIGGRSSCGAEHEHLRDGKATGWYVKHCGHPTANFPYYVETPGGAPFDRYGRGGVSCYRTLAEAKAATLLEIETGYGAAAAIPEVAEKIAKIEAAAEYAAGKRVRGARWSDKRWSRAKKAALADELAKRKPEIDRLVRKAAKAAAMGAAKGGK